MVVILGLFFGFLTFQGHLHLVQRGDRSVGVVRSTCVVFWSMSLSAFFGFENSTTCYLHLLETPKEDYPSGPSQKM